MDWFGNGLVLIIVSELDVFGEPLNMKQLLPKPRQTIPDVPNDMGLCNARKCVHGRLLACHPDAAGNLNVNLFKTRYVSTLRCSVSTVYIV